MQSTLSFLRTTGWILFWFNLPYALLVNFFDPTSPWNFQGQQGLIGPESLFGLSMLYHSPKEGLFISAPNALNKVGSDVEVGGVFKCPLKKDAVCPRHFVIPNPERYTIQKIELRPLFGMTMVKGHGNTMVICAPNIPFTQRFGLYCPFYDVTQGIRLVNKGGFPLVRKLDRRPFIDNYGMILANFGSIDDDPPSFIVGQVNFVYYNLTYFPTKETPFLVKEAPPQSQVNIPVKSVPSYSVLTNPSNPLMALIVFYSLTNNFQGSFEVYTDRLVSQQTVSVTPGYPKQFVGFSSALGRFNDDGCPDMAVSAPFYSPLDQGLVYVYLCNNRVKKFLPEPILLQGDQEAFARFGISIVSAGDLNHDSYDDLVVLAPYWYTKYPVIYIYLSNGNGFSDTYAQRLQLESKQNFVDVFSYGLLSGFDLNNDGVNDLAISFPNNNKVIGISGIRYTEIKLTTTFTVNENRGQPDQFCDDGGNNCELFLTYDTRVCLSLEYLTKKQLEYTITLNKRIGTQNPQTFFLVKERRTDELQSNTVINKLNNSECTILMLYHLYYPNPLYRPIILSVDADVKIETETCGENCIEPSPLRKEEVKYPEYLTCNAENCQPSLNLISLPSIKTMVIGVVNTVELGVRITHNGSISSYFTRLILTAPVYTTLVTSSVVDETQTDVEAVTQENSEQETVDIIVTAKKLQTNGQFLQFKLNLAVTPPLGATDFEFELKAIDPMFKHFRVQSETIPITLEDDQKLELSGVSLPSTLFIGQTSEKITTQSSSELKYVININNGYTVISLEEVVVVFEIPLKYKEKNILTLKDIEAPNFLIENCGAADLENCNEDSVILTTFQLPPNSVTKLTLTYNVLNTINMLAENGERKLVANCVVYFKGSTGQLKKQVKIETLVTYPEAISKSGLIVPIVVACILGLVLIIVCVFLLFWFKIPQRIRDATYDRDQL